MTTTSRPIDSLRERYASLRSELRERLPALGLALAIEVLIIALLISLGSVKREIVDMTDTLVAFTSPAREDPAQEEATAPEPAAAPEVAAQQPVPTPPREAAVRPRRPLTPPIPIPRPVAPSTFSLEDVPREAPTPAPSPQTFGPAFTPSPGDTPRIAGSGPNGEPLYAARWYREPYDDELAGYLSTAQGPGWGVIDCRTVANFRVEDCVVIAEAPQGSGIGEAARAAAWQFKIRPPQRGGRPMVGEWVRIRINYEVDPGEAARARMRN